MELEKRHRHISRGTAYVYMFLCHDEDLLKLGHSRNPLRRLQTLHPRYYEFFDIDAGWIIEVERVSEALTLERSLASRIRLHNAPAPIGVAPGAAGHTEWYRGAGERLRVEVERLSPDGLAILSLRPWLVQQLISDARLFSWSDATLSVLLQCEYSDEMADAARLTTVLRNVLDAYKAFDVDLEPRLAPPVWSWYSNFR